MSPAGDSDRRGGWRETAALLLLIAAVTYNLPLALLNAHVVGVGRNALIGVEVVIIGAALVLAASQWRPDMTRWAAMIGVFVLSSAVLSLLRQGFDPKSLRDMLMIATFVMLGMTVREPTARRLFVGLHFAILAVMLFEVLVPNVWASLVNSRSYVIATRGFSADQFYGDLELFGATRPDERYFLPALGWNRASSLFLEPLSLGNYCSFATLMMMVFWRDWRWPLRIALLVGWALLLVGSDSRFAGISSVLLVLAAPVLIRLPAVLALAYLPLAVVFARILSRALAWNPLEDNFPGRIARGMKGLFKLDVYQLTGFSVPTPALADSGIAYLVMAQSLAGVVVMQLFLWLTVQPLDKRQRLMLHGTALSFALSILVSISMMSIKTAAFYWLFLGVLLTRSAPTTRPAGIAAGGPLSRRVPIAQPL